jgi:hypothetical protein
LSLKKALAAVMTASLCVLSPVALAVVVLQPFAVSVDPALGTSSGFPELSMINQAGLTGGATYMSGVTGYDAYIASNPNHNAAAAGQIWVSDTNKGVTGYLDFDLGGTFTLTNIALWSGVTNNQGFGGLKSFDVSVDGVLAGSYPVDNQFNPLFAQSFKLPSAMAGSHVRFDLTESYSTDAVSIAEVAFGVASMVSVSEPSTVALLAFGLVGFGLRNKPLLQRA